MCLDDITDCLPQIKDQLINCQVNRELSRRVKMSSPLVWARSVVQSDLQLAIKLTQVLDEQHQLWEHSPKPVQSGGEATTGQGDEVHTSMTSLYSTSHACNLPSRNPTL